MSLIEKIRSEIARTIEDTVLVNAEKKEIKQLLTELAPDKQTCDLLRSHIFDLATTHIEERNYQSVIKWVEDLNKVLLSVQKEEKIDERVYFSPGEDCLNAILYQINNTRQVMQICLFTISDNRISDALMRQHKNGVHVKIITDNDKIYDKGSDIEELHQSGIPIKVDITENHMHHKFALFDKKTTITGSYNWTRSAEKYNHENIVITDSSSLMSAFEKEFNALWNTCVYYEEI